jgi:hypothetical protein
MFYELKFNYLKQYSGFSFLLNLKLSYKQNSMSDI